jgi:myo-inositol-1(or 4)-monophosphatase
MFDKYLETAIKAAKAAGDYLRLRNNIRVEKEETRDIKLSSDTDSEAIILDALACTGFRVLTEESGVVGENSEYCWIVDPLDGTVNYYKGLDELSCVSIALFHGNDPVLGVINRFRAGELFTGVVGSGAELNGAAVRTSGVVKLGSAVMAAGLPSKHDFSRESLTAFVHNIQRVKKVRMLGSAAIMAAFVACGRFDLYYEENIRLWDIAAAAAVVKSAGGAASLELCPNDDLHRCNFGAFATEELMEAYRNA